MKKWLFKLLIRWYLKENREITKLTPEDELQLYTFEKPEYVERLLKSVMTAQTLWYWEAKDKYEQDVVRGSALILKTILEAHRQVLNIWDTTKTTEEALKVWEQYKFKKRIN